MKARPVYEEPEITLEVWAIVIGPEGRAHFAGSHKGTRLRLSTAIEEFDLEAMTGKTSSGRTYRLAGDRGDGLGLAATAIFRGALALQASSVISPEELALMLAPTANRWGA